MTIRRTKILATLGPASREPAILDELIRAGLDAVRLNFSHGTHEAHAETYRRVREASARAKKPIAVLQDLQGPKVRIGLVKGEMPVPSGSQLVITTRQLEGENGVVSTVYAGLPRDVVAGDSILLDEGRITLRVREIRGEDIVCDVEDGGFLSSNKGINVPGAALTTSAMTPKDEADLRFGLALGVDFVALSFVRRGTDVENLREVMRGLGRVVPIVAKIEKPQASMLSTRSCGRAKASWWPEEISASRSRSSTSRLTRRGSSAPPTRLESSSSPRRRCSSR